MKVRKKRFHRIKKFELKFIGYFIKDEPLKETIDNGVFTVHSQVDL